MKRMDSGSWIDLSSLMVKPAAEKTSSSG